VATVNVLGLHFDTLFGLTSLQWTPILLPIVLLLLTLASRRKARVVDGWHLLRPTLGMYLIGGIAIPMALMFTVAPFIAAAALLDAPRDGPSWLLLSLCPALIFISWYTVGYVFFVSVQFNEDGVSRSLFRSEMFIPWDDAQAVKRHWFFGPQLLSDTDRKIVIWEYLRGYEELVDFARSKGVTVSVSPTDHPA
jgi:hypothetical protein